MTCPVTVLISGEGSNLQALLDDAAIPGAPYRIQQVVCNRPNAHGLDRAREAGVPTEVVDHRDFPNREAFDEQLLAALAARPPELVVLAGFMRILTSGFITPWTGRLLNIHPSLLPAHKGLHTHSRALQAGDREHGATVHFVVPELDAGPTILQARVPILPEDTPDALAARVLVEEHRIYPQAVRWFAQGRLRLRDGRAWLDGSPIAA